MSGVRGAAEGLEAGQVALLDAARATRRHRWRRGRPRSARPNWATAAALSPPPMTVKPRLSATASATARVPASKRGSSNTPIGPFQRIGAGLGDDVAELGGGAGADVEAHPAVGQRAAELADLSPGGRVTDLAARARGRRCRSAGAGGRRARRAGAGRCRSGRPRAARRRSGGPCAARKVKHMPPPMIDRVGDVEQGRRCTPSLSRHLRAAEDGDERARWRRSRRPSRTSTSLASSRPAADGSGCGGPTIEAWARCDAPNASLT